MRILLDNTNWGIKMTSIIILTYNNLEYTIRCIESIRKYTEKDTYEIIVVDNNSVDGTVDWLVKQADVIKILNKENNGFPKGCNQGIEAAEGDYIMLLNNDTIVTTKWLSNLLKCINSSEDIGAVGPVTNSCAYFQSIPVNYNSVEEMINFAEEYNNSNIEMWEEKLKLIGFCLLIKKKVLDEVGLLDERFFPGNFEDDDICCRINERGYRLLLCKDTFIHHYGGASFKKNEGFNSIIKENENKFKEKWGFTSRENMDIHKEISELINIGNNEKFKLLDVGCGCGANLLYLKNKFSEAEFYGIDINNEALKLAKKQFQCICGDIETIMLPFEKKYFDYILLGDIIQQFKEPEKVLKKIKSYIKSSGKLLISSPNIMNYYVIYNLIKGNSLYNNDRIEYFINNRNIKSFNFLDIYNLIDGCGFSNISGTKVLSEVEDGDNNFIDGLCNVVAVQDKEQFIIKKYVLSADVVDCHKICFIFYVNDTDYYKETLKYIERLRVPDGFTVESLCITNEESIAKGYNEAMGVTNAKYKIYLHQDVRIINQDFLFEVLNTFQSSKDLGLIGVIGSKDINNKGVWWNCNEMYGKVYENDDGKMKLMNFKEVKKSFEKCKIVDGVIIMTQYDLQWREDIFDGRHFYDAAQCFEFINEGYEVAVIRQYDPYCIHDRSIITIEEEYEKYRQKFVKEYLENE